MEFLLSKKTRDIETVIYLILFFTYLLFNRIVPITYIFDPINGLLFSAFAGFGCLLILQDVLTDRYLFKVRFSWVLCLFLGVLTISNIINIQYGWMDNVKTMVWFCIHFFVIYTLSYRIKTENNKKIIYTILFFSEMIFLVFVIVSIIQYSLQVKYLVPIHEGIYKCQGFYNNRLFGVFSDPNSAAIIVCWFICFNFNILKKFKIKTYKFLLIMLNVIFYIFIVLSGSRSVQLILFLIILFYMGICYFKKKHSKKSLFKFIIKITLTLFLFFPVFNCSKICLSYIPVLIRESGISSLSTPYDTNEQFVQELHNSKNRLNRPEIANGNFFTNRIEIWTGYLTSLKSGKWLFGLSPRNAISYIEEHYPDNYIAESGFIAHSDYLAIIAYTGLAGFAVFVLLAILILQYVFKKIHVKKKLDDFYVMSLLIVFSILVYGLSYRDILFCNTFTGFVFWLFMSYILNVKDDGIYEEDSTPSV